MFLAIVGLEMYPQLTFPTYILFFKSLFLICYNIASVLHFGFLTMRPVGS